MFSFRSLFGVFVCQRWIDSVSLRVMLFNVSGLTKTFANDDCHSSSHIHSLSSAGSLLREHYFHAWSTELYYRPIGYHLFWHSDFTFPVLVNTVPLSLLAILALHTRANLRLFTVRHTISRMEQQMTSMILLQTLSASCLIPYAINFFYTAITRFVRKSEYQAAVENCITQIVTLGFYAHYASGFYIYLIASRDVRRHVRKVCNRI